MGALDVNRKPLLPRRRLGVGRQAFQHNIHALHAGLVELDDDVGRFKTCSFNVQGVLANGKLERTELVGCSRVNAVKRDASIGRIRIEDQRSNAVPFVTSLGVAASLARIFTGIRTGPPIIGRNIKR